MAARSYSAPTASIVSAPTKSKVGSSITLKGSGNDPDGYIVAYNWTSNRQGFLGDKAEITISNLSIGEHIISFSVCDDKGTWSSPALITIKIEKRESTTQDNNMLLIFIAILVILAIIVILLLLLRKKKTPVQPVILNTDTEGSIGQAVKPQPPQSNDIPTSQTNNDSQPQLQNNLQPTDNTQNKDTKNDNSSNQNNIQNNTQYIETNQTNSMSNMPLTQTTPAPKLEAKTTESELQETAQITDEVLHIKAHEQIHASAKELVSKNDAESWYSSPKQQNEVPTAIPIATPISDGKPKIIASQEEDKLEQLFLVYNDGRLIEKWPKEKGVIDGDTVSSMLTAVQEFVKDSFARR
ncbi:MAG: hypothetical protein QXT63_01080 [Thermoplasmata archaeon]